MNNSKPKFTPGPWSAFKYPDTKNFTVSAGESVASRIKTSENAALIAAAPEMYEALEYLMKKFGPYAVDSDREAPPFNLTVKGTEIEKILAKARGEK